MIIDLKDKTLPKKFKCIILIRTVLFDNEERKTGSSTDTNFAFSVSLVVSSCHLYDFLPVPNFNSLELIAVVKKCK